jgi:hypothetical protein
MIRRAAPLSLDTRQKMFAVMFIPRSGLFYSGGGRFVDGDDNPVAWNQSILVRRTFEAADQSRKDRQAKFAGQGDQIVITAFIECLPEEDDPVPSDAEYQRAIEVAKDILNRPRATDFMECDTCRAKPGSPPLCIGCLHNRSMMNNLALLSRQLLRRSPK